MNRIGEAVKRDLNNGTGTNLFQGSRGGKKIARWGMHSPLYSDPDLTKIIKRVLPFPRKIRPINYNIQKTTAKGERESLPDLQQYAFAFSFIKECARAQVLQVD